ncbi:hypothetical protein ADK60_01210 [Streptomyces sp. XY431]|nr:hypothetical protein ADK60_01210 [Streptomyces sp. XY431]
MCPDGSRGCSVPRAARRASYTGGGIWKSGKKGPRGRAREGRSAGEDVQRGAQSAGGLVGHGLQRLFGVAIALTSGVAFLGLRFIAADLATQPTGGHSHGGEQTPAEDGRRSTGEDHGAGPRGPAVALETRERLAGCPSRHCP